MTGEARLTIDVLKQGWVSIQMPSGLLVRGARLEGRPTALVDGNPPRVLVSRPGRSMLALEIVVPIEAASGIESMTLPASASALSAVTLIVPRTGVDLTVSGGFVAEQTEANAENRWTVYGAPGRPLRFSWKRKIDDRRSTLPLRAKARITELVALGEDASQITVSVSIEVVQGLARDVVLTIPEGVSVNQVSGATVADWKHESGTLTVSFLEPIAASTSLVISAEVRAPREGSIAIPIVRMPAAERETGGVAVDVIGAGEITDRQPRGVDPADPSDLGDILEGRESPSMVAFGFRPLPGSAARTLTVTVSRYTPQAVLVANVEEARYEVLVGEDGKMLVRARYAVRNNQRAFLALKLPAQSVLWSAALAGRPIRPGVSADGGYLLPLLKGRAGEAAPTFAVELGVPATHAGVDRQRRGPRRVAGCRSPRLAHGAGGPSLAALSRRRHTWRLPDRIPAGAMERGPAKQRVRHAGSTGTTSPPAALAGGNREADSAKALVDRFRKDMGRTSAGTIPVHVAVPDIGPSFFVAAELTAEAQAPALDVQYKRLSER